jgi:CspA family cold shock protein
LSKGTIIRFNYKKGYGLIESDEGGIIFVHYTAMQNEDYYRLYEGQRVNFDIKHGQENNYAANVKTIHNV